jgi:hypothetical protein
MWSGLVARVGYWYVLSVMLSDILLSVICYMLTILLVVCYLLWQKMIWNLVINYDLVMMRWHRMMVYVAVKYELVCQL